MPDKLEVLAGPGLVARYDEVAIWAGPQASPALQVHLVNEAQRTSKGANGGDQLASSLIAILQRGDPEPQAPFAVVGPGANGLTLFLHGPVQAWDNGRWLAPQPVPGWMVTSIGRPWPLIILPYGASPPPQSQQGNPLDLTAGAVPGSGFVMLRPPPVAGQASAAPPGMATPQPSPTGYAPAVAGSGSRRRCGRRWSSCRRGGRGWSGRFAGAAGFWPAGLAAGAGPGGAGPGGAGAAGSGAAEMAGAAVVGAAAGMAAAGMAAAGSTIYGEPSAQQTPVDGGAGPELRATCAASYRRRGCGPGRRLRRVPRGHHRRFA